MTMIPIQKKSTRKRLWENRVYYMYLIPSFISVFLFSYLTIFGLVIAFQDFSIIKGFFGSEFVGFKNFEVFLNDPMFYKVFFYTIKVSIVSFVFSFPAPIIFALMLNEIRKQRIKKLFQSVSYMPHFLSWVIAASVVYRFLESGGIINSLITAVGGGEVNFLGDSDKFISVVVLSGIWKSLGWGSIVYLAAISNVNPELYEAAVLDGAGKLKQARYVTIPSILPTIIILMIYSVGGLLSVNFDQVYNLQNDLIRNDTNVINTYIFYKGIQQGKYSLSTAFGMLQSVITFGLITGTNAFSRKVSEVSLW